MAIKIEQAGYKRYVEMLSFEGKTRDGARVGRECFRDTLTGKMVFPEKGWNGDLETLEHGDLACVITASDRYRQNYEQIRWEKDADS
jgi:hypothetical protein